MVGSGTASRRFGCPSCGGGLQYDIASRRMKCDMCGGLTPLEDLPPEQPEDTMEVTEFHCPQCGAAVYSTDTEVTSFCSFCGSDVVLTGKLSRTRRPAKIVPFSVTREACEQAYRDHLKSFLLAPSELKKAETLSHFRPVYVPFWSYSVNAQGPAELRGKKSFRKGNYEYEETYGFSMDAEIRQDGILYDASTAFEDETAVMLKHTTRDTVPFHPAYLSGFYAQGADVPGETYAQEAAASAARIFIDRIREEKKMDSVELVGDVSENFGLPNAEIREEMVMMPVWLLAHRQGDRVVYTAVNGESGEVVCDVPVSGRRVLGVTLALTAALFLLASRFLTLRPEMMMGLCAILSVITQYQFSGAQKALFNRSTRAFEPDFEDRQRTFVGPAQSLLNRRKSGISTKSGTASDMIGKAKGYAVILLYPLLLVILAAGSRLMSAFGSSGNRRVIVLWIMLIALIIMGIHTYRRSRKEGAGPLWPRVLSCAACAAGLVCTLLALPEDLYYYICALAMLAASAAELVIINRAHNEYASRPVPFFEGKEEAV